MTAPVVVFDSVVRWFGAFAYRYAGRDSASP